MLSRYRSSGWAGRGTGSSGWRRRAAPGGAGPAGHCRQSSPARSVVAAAPSTIDAWPTSCPSGSTPHCPARAPSRPCGRCRGATRSIRRTTCSSRRGADTACSCSSSRAAPCGPWMPPARTWSCGSRSSPGWRAGGGEVRRARRRAGRRRRARRADGAPSRRALQAGSGRAVSLLAFDLLHHDGTWLIGQTPRDPAHAAPQGGRRRRRRRRGAHGRGRGHGALRGGLSPGDLGRARAARTSPYLPGVRSRLWRSIAARSSDAGADGVAPEPEAAPARPRGGPRCPPLRRAAARRRLRPYAPRIARQNVRGDGGWPYITTPARYTRMASSVHQGHRHHEQAQRDATLPRLHPPHREPRQHHERAPQRHVRRHPDDPGGAPRERQHRRAVARHRRDRERQRHRLEVLLAAQQRTRPRVQRGVEREPQHEVHDERQQEARRQRRQGAAAPSPGPAARRRWRPTPASRPPRAPGPGDLRQPATPIPRSCQPPAAGPSPRISATP